MEKQPAWLVCALYKLELMLQEITVVPQQCPWQGRAPAPAPAPAPATTPAPATAAASLPLPAAGESFQRLWSNASQWPEGELPALGADVEIPAAWRVVLDISPEPLGLLTISGELCFADSG